MTIRGSAAVSAVVLAVAVATVAPVDPGTTARSPGAAAAAGSPAPRTTTGSAGSTVKVRLRWAVKRLPVAVEVRRGYDRDEFKHWIDSNGDCQDTRDEVLAAESAVEVSGCDIATGEWLSYYDGEVWTDSSDVDIDHLVPLAEAWDSGARRWTKGTRTRYANDLKDPRPLVAVTDNVNQSKSDQDPADWMPGLGTCRYVREWVAVKIRWQLSVNRPERRVLRNRAADCTNVVVKVQPAKVVRRTARSG